MLCVLENISLRPFNTFGVNATARYFIPLEELSDIKELLHLKIFNSYPSYILGGGSNVLFIKDYKGIIVRPDFKGIEVLSETDDHLFVKVMAGENWDEFVGHCVRNNWAGVENLSLIPGNVGSAPIQNIGAYGVEIKDVFHSLEAVRIDTGKFITMKHDDCKFGYRDSIFKHELKQKMLIVSVVFKLSKNESINVAYESLSDRINGESIFPKSLGDVREIISDIRRKKLPDPNIFGNAGSFFKNPTVNAIKHKTLLKTFSEVKSFVQEDGSYKLAAGWLIEKCGWKGYRKENVGVHPQQALVLVNYGKASGKEIMHLANDITKSVSNMFDVQLEIEVNVV